VCFHRVLTDVQEPTDFFIALAERHLRENLKFALGLRHGAWYQVHAHQVDIKRVVEVSSISGALITAAVGDALDKVIPLDANLNTFET
jgi:hypothetical protein